MVLLAIQIITLYDVGVYCYGDYCCDSYTATGLAYCDYYDDADKGPNYGSSVGSALAVLIVICEYVMYGHEIAMHMSRPLNVMLPKPHVTVAKEWQSITAIQYC